MDDDQTKKTREDASSALEVEGIVIETEKARTELENNLNTPPTKEAKKELFEAIGVEIPNKNTEEKPIEGPKMSDLEDNLNKEGIELLRTDTTEEGNP